MVARLFFILSLCVATYGCATTNTVRNANQDAGISRVFNNDYDTVKAAAAEAIERLNVNIRSTEETSTSYQVIFSKSISAFSWGEVGRVLVFRNSGEGTKVTVSAEKRSQLQITGTNEQKFASEIFAGIDEELKALGT
ncbi:MAG: hypothetical protein AAF607_16730 [Pseudomonadota bacterium]